MAAQYKYHWLLAPGLKAQRFENYQEADAQARVLVEHGVHASIYSTNEDVAPWEKAKRASAC